MASKLRRPILVPLISVLWFAMVGAKAEDVLIRLPTMDYSASLGDVYDYTRERFTGENIFPEGPLEGATKVEHISQVQYGLKLIESLEEKLKFLELEPSVGVEVLIEALKPLGATRYLLGGSSEVGVGDVEAILFRKMSTVREVVNVFADPMSTNIYKDVLEESAGTHVVVGISYGYWTLVSITLPNTQGNRQGSRAQLKEFLTREYHNYEEEGGAAEQTAPSPSMVSGSPNAYTVEYFGDGKLSQGKPRTIPGIRKYLEDPENVPEEIREGKGQALVIYLKPLKDLHEGFHHEEPHNQPFFDISVPDLGRVLNRFQEILEAQRALSTLRTEFFDFSCTPPEENSFIQGMSLGFEEAVREYKESLRSNLSSIKAAGYRVDGEDELLGFDFGNFAPGHVFTLVSNRTAVLREKTSHCRTLMEKGLQVVTSGEGLKSVLGQSEKIIHVLYFSPALIQQNVDLWESNLELALKLKKSASTEVVAFQCDHSPCNGLNSTVIQEYIGGSLVSRDVHQALEGYQPVPKLKLTLGGEEDVHLGNTFTSARGAFAESTIFGPRMVWDENPKVKLLQCAIYDYSFEGIFQALGAEPVEQLLALKDEEALEAGRSILVAQMVTTEQWVNTLESQVATKDLKDLQETTHFVSKVLFGINLFFQSTHLQQEERSALVEAKPVLCQALDAIRRGVSVLSFPLELAPLNLTLSEDFRPNTWRTPLTNDNLASYFSSILERKTPIQYIMEPIQNLEAQVGLLLNLTSSSTKATTTPELVKAVTQARAALDDRAPNQLLTEFLKFMNQNQDCVSSQDMELVRLMVQAHEEMVKDLRSNLTFQINRHLNGALDGAELESWAKDLSTKVPTGPKVSEDLKSSFGGLKEKVEICRMLASGPIKYAKSLESLNSEQIHSAATKEVYILILKGEWIGSKRGNWSENLSKFLGAVARGEHELMENKIPAKLIVFDCDAAPDEAFLCRGRSQPVILGYKNGVLLNEDVAELIQAEEIGNRVFLEQLRQTITERLNNIPPEGFIYIQYHNQLEPQALWPHLTWEEVTPTYEGQFFRAAGGSAAAFGEEQPGQYPGIRDIGKVVLNHDEAQESCILSRTRNCSMIVGDIPGESSSLATKTLWAGLNKGGSGGDGSISKASVPKVALNGPQSTKKETIRFGYEQKEVWPRNSAIRIWKRV